MAKLQVSAELLLDSLFKGQAPGVRLIGASVDPITQTVELDLEGPAIPCCRAHQCHLHSGAVHRALRAEELTLESRK